MGYMKSKVDVLLEQLLKVFDNYEKIEFFHKQWEKATMESLPMICESLIDLSTMLLDEVEHAK